MCVRGVEFGVGGGGGGGCAGGVLILRKATIKVKNIGGGRRGKGGEGWGSLGGEKDWRR